MSFDSFGLSSELLRGVVELGFTEPTPIQQQAIPAALQGKDVLACSMTGSGKTAAFGLPILNRLQGKNKGVTRALILTPTRELAAQIDDHLSALCRYTRMKVASVYGGVSMGPQKRAFYDGVDIIVATPGRLMDHFQYDYSRLDGLEVLVLDEADRMLDMGFLPDIKRIMQRLPKNRQTLLFSATMPPPIASLTREILKDPLRLNVERKAAPAVGITETVYPVPHLLKSSLCLKLLQSGNMKSTLIFTRTKARADRLSHYLERAKVRCTRIHGDRSQSQRQAALDGFKSGRYDVLVATDIAARGIDVDELSHVINFDVPNQSEDYIHRVGRTARAKATGDAFTFVSQDEEADLRMIEKAINKKLPRVTLPDFDYTNVPVMKHTGGGHSGGGHGGQSFGGQRHQRRGNDRNDRGSRNERYGRNGGQRHSSGFGDRQPRFNSDRQPQFGGARPAGEANGNVRQPEYAERVERFSDEQPASNESYQPKKAPHRPWERERGNGQQRSAPWAKRKKSSFGHSLAR
ncbi:MAG TPA: DEAD/DEAH box helicase [Planctomycetota bacterium]|nr:DEAD/DEAH box helicase [Planctomycetota bacterium]